MDPDRIVFFFGPSEDSKIARSASPCRAFLRLAAPTTRSRSCGHRKDGRGKGMDKEDGGEKQRM